MLFYRPSYPRFCVALVLCTALFAGSVTHVDAAPTITTNVNFPAPTPQESALGAKAPFGVTNVTSLKTGVQENNGNYTITVDVNVDVQINTSRIGEKYTEKQEGDCQGLTFPMTADWVKSHEMQHVADIRAAVEKVKNQMLADNPAPGNPSWVNLFKQKMEQAAQKIIQEDEKNYSEAEGSSNFPADSAEGRARLKSCKDYSDELMKPLVDAQKEIDDGKDDLKNSAKALTSADQKADAAKKAAAAALRAAKNCDWKAFRKAFGEYKDAKKAAEDFLKDAQKFQDAAKNRIAAVTNLLAQYDALKAQKQQAATAWITGTTAKDDQRRADEAKRLDSVQVFKAADKKKAELKEQLKEYTKLVDEAAKKFKTKKEQIEKKLAAAEDDIKKALEALKKCGDAQKKIPENKATLEELEKFIEKKETPPAETPQAPPPVDKDPKFKSIAPGPQQRNPDEHSYLPKTAGPGSAIVATIEEPNRSGPTDAVVTLITADGAQHSYKTRSDGNHRLHFNLPRLLAGVAIAEVLLSKGFDRDGHPDERAAKCLVGADAVVPNTDAVPNAPDVGVAILRGASAYDRTPGKGIVDLQVRELDPATARVLLDGRPDGIITRAASNTSVEGELQPALTEGRHSVEVVSRGGTTNAMQSDVVTLIPHQPPPSPSGTVQTLTIECHGLGADPATLTVRVSGAATLAEGGDAVTVPITNGVAQVRIRGVRPGAAVVEYKLHVKIPGYWTS